MNVSAGKRRNLASDIFWFASPKSIAPMRQALYFLTTLSLVLPWQGLHNVTQAQQTELQLWDSANVASKDAGCGYELGRGESLVSCVVLEPATLQALRDGSRGEYGELVIDIGGELGRVTSPRVVDARASRISIDGILDSSGSLFQLSVAGVSASGSFRRDGTLYEVKPTASGLNAVVRVDESARTQGLVDVIDVEDATLPWTWDGLGKSASADIKLLLLWDDNLLTLHGQSGLDAMEADYMAYLNGALVDGGASDVSFSVAQSTVITYDETQFADMSDDLRALQSKTDGVLDSIHDTRLAAGADLVHLFVPSYKQTTCGIAYASVVGANYGFGVTGISGCGMDTFAHEVGHNLGLNHDPYVTSDPNYYWSHGYVDLSNGFRTIMSYQNECADSGVACPRVRLFSDPATTYGGVPVGTPDNPPAASSNNVRVIRANAASRANYSDILDACLAYLYGGTTGPATARVGDEFSFQVPMSDQGDTSACNTTGAYGLYLIGSSGAKYRVARQSITLPESPSMITFTGTPSVPDPPTGSYDVRLYEEVTGSWWASIAQIEILPAVTNAAPTASFTASSTTGQAPHAIDFDASASSDPNGDALTYAWDFGDGASGTGATTSHTYATAGTFAVTLMVSDGSLTDAQTTSVTISAANAAPTASFTASSTTGQAPHAIDFDASASSDPNGDALTYAWDFGDGASGTGATTSHTYATAGTFAVTLMVSDGSLSDAQTLEVTIASGVSTEASDGPVTFALYPAYPNPFNPTTRIAYSLPEPRFVSIWVTDMTGRIVARLLDGSMVAPGRHEVAFNASGLPSGNYIMTVQAGSERKTQVLSLLK